MVDIARPSQARKKKIRRAIYGGVAIAAIALISVGVSRLKPAAPSVDRAVVWIDTVKRGPMLRQVRGSGTLVPEDIRWLPAQTQGRVERIVLRPGAQVTPDTVILELSNPELEQTVREAQLAYQSALAAFENRKAELQSALLSQEADTANIEAHYKQAALDLEANEQLVKGRARLRTAAEAEARRDRRAEEPARRRAAAAGNHSAGRQVAARAAGSGRESEEGRVGAAAPAARGPEGQGRHGRRPPVRCSNRRRVERGSQVAPGTNLARVANPTHLKAELRIAETQTKDIRIGQYAEVDTRNGVVKGHVSRIDPASQGGTVGVDVIMDGATADRVRVRILSVDGTIQLES